MVNGRRVDIPSYSCKPGDVIELREASRDNEMFKTNFQELRSFELPYIEKDLEGFKATFTRLPQREELPIEVNETLIVNCTPNNLALMGKPLRIGWFFL